MLLAYSTAYKNYKPYTLKKSEVFSSGKKKIFFLENGSVVTVADAVPQPNGQDPARETAPLTRIDADNCDDASSNCQS